MEEDLRCCGCLGFLAVFLFIFFPLQVLNEVLPFVCELVRAEQVNVQTAYWWSLRDYGCMANRADGGNGQVVLSY